MPTVTLPNEWRPRPYQRRTWDYFERGGKRGAVVAHRRWGKDDLALHLTSVKAHERVATYWHMLPEFSQGRRAIWDAVNPHTGKRRIDEAFPPEIRARSNAQAMNIELRNGSMWHVVGSDNYNSLVGSPPAGIVLSEWAIADPASWAFLSPILLENDGWALFIYTSRGRNHGYTTYKRALESPDWHAELATAEQTGVFTAAQLENERQEYHTLYGRDIGNMLFEQEYMCSFEGAQLGAYYAREMLDAQREGRIGPVPYDKFTTVNTWWDLGVEDATAIWFVQRIGMEIHVVDYYEGSGVGLDHYAEVLESKRREHGFPWGTHYLPHDIQARELTTGRSRLETLRGLLPGQTVDVVPLHSVLDGINATRRILPRCWFDEKRCERGLEALRQYRTEYDEKHKVFRRNPLHNWASHGADAFRTGCAQIDDTAAKKGPDRYHRKPVRGGTSWMAA